MSKSSNISTKNVAKFREYIPNKRIISAGFMRAEFLNLSMDFLFRNSANDSHEKLRSDNAPLRKIVGLMWNCTDWLPVHEAELISIGRSGGNRHANVNCKLTYAQAARIIRKRLNLLEDSARRRERPKSVPAVNKHDVEYYWLDDLLDGLDLTD
jgi:hypothetical protein